MTDVSPETVERLIALVKRMDGIIPYILNSGITDCFSEARAIAAELPAPVDPDAEIAKALVGPLDIWGLSRARGSPYPCHRCHQARPHPRHPRRPLMVREAPYSPEQRSKLLGGLLTLESRSMGLETGLAGVSDAEFMAEVRRRDVEWRGEGL